jgi:hypothetical protein
MIYIGDALFVDGNDYAVQQAGVVSISVRGPEDTKRVIQAIIACLGGDDQVNEVRPQVVIAPHHAYTEILTAMPTPG